MFKLFNRGKGHQSPFKAPLVPKMQNPQLPIEKGMSIDEAQESLKHIETGVILMRVERDRLRAENKTLTTTNRDLNLWVEDLKNQIAQMASQRKVYQGQKFYNPDNHKAPTIYLCARWNEFYMIRQQNEAVPVLMTDEQFNTLYGHYVLMPKQNFNRKRLG